MKRLHLFELEDQTWLPASIRDAGTDFLRFISEAGNLYTPIIPKLQGALIKTGSQEVLDLCSGGAGPIIGICKRLAEKGCAVRITLTDKYPNYPAFDYAKKRSGGAVDFLEDSVDATEVPSHLSGFRTFFASLHHFRPETARLILQDAVDQRRPIGIFDMSAGRAPPLPMMLLSNPLAMLLVTPLSGHFDGAASSGPTSSRLFLSTSRGMGSPRDFDCTLLRSYRNWWTGYIPVTVTMYGKSGARPSRTRSPTS